MLSVAAIFITISNTVVVESHGLQHPLGNAKPLLHPQCLIIVRCIVLALLISFFFRKVKQLIVDFESMNLSKITVAHHHKPVNTCPEWVSPKVKVLCLFPQVEMDIALQKPRKDMCPVLSILNILQRKAPLEVVSVLQTLNQLPLHFTASWLPYPLHLLPWSSYPNLSGRCPNTLLENLSSCSCQLDNTSEFPWFNFIPNLWQESLMWLKLILLFADNISLSIFQQVPLVVLMQPACGAYKSRWIPSSAISQSSTTKSRSDHLSTHLQKKLVVCKTLSAVISYTIISIPS